MQLHFITGTMGSMKTLQLIAKHREFSSRGYTVRTAVPEKDIRYGGGKITSRAGLELQADLIIYPDGRVNRRLWLECDPDRLTRWILMVDEVQFLTVQSVESLRRLVDKHNIEVYAYGIRTDFETKLFDGSRRMLELADRVTVLDCDCSFCIRPAVFNMRLGQLDGGQVVLGGDELYKPTCSSCYYEETGSRDENKTG